MPSDEAKFKKPSPNFLQRMAGNLKRGISKQSAEQLRELQEQERREQEAKEQSREKPEPSKPEPHKDTQFIGEGNAQLSDAEKKRREEARDRKFRGGLNKRVSPK